jgi:UDP-N-acetylglucosamine acyltransferase
MIGGLAAITRDVPPFGLVAGGRPARLHGINVIGLRRAGVTPTARRQIKIAFRQLFTGGENLRNRVTNADVSCPEVAQLLDFVKASKRGLVGFGGSASRKEITHEVGLVDRDNLDALGNGGG